MGVPQGLGRDLEGIIALLFLGAKKRTSRGGSGGQQPPRGIAPEKSSQRKATSGTSCRNPSELRAKAPQDRVPWAVCCARGGLAPTHAAAVLREARTVRPPPRNHCVAGPALFLFFQFSCNGARRLTKNKRPTINKLVFGRQARPELF